MVILSLQLFKILVQLQRASLDYLVREGINSKFDKKTVTRLLDIEKLDHTDKEHVFAMLDAILAKNKLQAILK